MRAERVRPINIRFTADPTFVRSAGLRLIPDIYESQCAGRSRACEDLFRMRDSERAQREAFQLVLATGAVSNTKHPVPAARFVRRTNRGIDHLPGCCFTSRRCEELEGFTTSSAYAGDQTRRHPRPGPRPRGVARGGAGHPVGAAADA